MMNMVPPLYPKPFGLASFTGNPGGGGLLGAPAMPMQKGGGLLDSMGGGTGIAALLGMLKGNGLRPTMPSPVISEEGALRQLMAGFNGTPLG